MALALGVSSGFVTTAPTADPDGNVSVAIDGAARITKHTTPANTVRITEIGWYRNAGTDTSNFEVGLYAADGAVVPGEAGTRLYVDATNSSSSTGWITTAVDWAVDPLTVYWLAVQMDAHTGSSNIDGQDTNGVGLDSLAGQTTLPNPFGGGAFTATAMLAIYALVEIDAGTSVKDIIGGFGIIPFAR